MLRYCRYNITILLKYVASKKAVTEKASDYVAARKFSSRVKATEFSTFPDIFAWCEVSSYFMGIKYLFILQHKEVIQNINHHQGHIKRHVSLTPYNAVIKAFNLFTLSNVVRVVINICITYTCDVSRDLFL